MKYLIYIVPFLVFFSCVDSTRISIQAEIEEGRGRTIYLDKLEISGPKELDSVKIKSTNRLSFSQKITEPTFYRLRIDNRNFITLLVEPGEKITIEANASNLPGTYHVYGSEGSELLKKLNDQLLLTKKQLNPLVDEIIALEEGPEFGKEYARINEELEKIIKDQRNFSIAFILENIESLAAITALYQQLDDENYILNQTKDIQFLKIVAQSLIKIYPKSSHVRALVADAENQEQQYEIFKLLNLAEEKGDVITTYPDIAMPGINGDTINLHSLNERYILLFFGSTYDQASVQLSHELIPIHRAYNNKGFQIYHVSIEQDREEWIRRIAFSELPWINVVELGEGRFSAAQKYNVQQIPSNYLINRDAGVVAVNLTVTELQRRLARALD